MAPDVPQVCSRALPEARVLRRPWGGVRPGTAGSDAAHADDRRDAAVHPDAGTVPDLLPVRPADGAGRSAGRALACPDAFLHPATLAAAEWDAAEPEAEHCTPGADPSAARSCGGPASADARARPAADESALLRLAVLRASELLELRLRRPAARRERRLAAPGLPVRMEPAPRELRARSLPELRRASPRFLPGAQPGRAARAA